MRNPEEKFLVIYEKHSDAIFRHCYFRVSSKELAENLTQETFMRAWKYLLEKEEIKNMKALLYRIAGNLVIDYYRKKKESSLENMTEAGFQIASNEDKEMKTATEIRGLMDKLDELEPKYSEVLIMRFIDDMRPREIAKVLDLKVNVVSVRIHRGVEKLKYIYVSS
ncbi:MAG: RNA polymerase sigma factor [bacterium]|nr:RNA polymerase sigma factor [bacterium]